MNVVHIVKLGGLQPYFLRLVSINGQILAVSEGYFSKWNAKRAARKNFAGLKVIDLTKGWAHEGHAVEGSLLHLLRRRTRRDRNGQAGTWCR